MKDAIVVGHDIDNDIHALDYTVAEFSSLVHCVYDTADNAFLNCLVPSERGKPKSKLANLAHHLFGKTIQANEDGHHDPVEDAFAALEIFLAHEGLFKEAPSNPRHDIATLTSTGQTFRLP